MAKSDIDIGNIILVGLGITAVVGIYLYFKGHKPKAVPKPTPTPTPTPSPSPKPNNVKQKTPWKTFNGTSDHVTVPSTAALKLNQFSIVAWFKTTKNYNAPTSSDPEGEEGMILVKGRWVVGSEHVNYGLWVTDANGLRGGFESANGTNYLSKIPGGTVRVPNHKTGTFPVPPTNDGKWHYGVVTHDGARVKLYLDSVLKDNRPTNGAKPETSNMPLRVGSNNFEGHEAERGSKMWFKGELYGIKVYNRALLASEISAGYNGLTINPSGLVYETVS